MDSVFIYALKHPATGEVRYVGKAQNPKARLSVHLSSKERNHRTNWISSLVSQGLKPELEIVDEVPVSEWPMWEVAYIQFFRDSGCDLVNGTVGGEGSLNPSAETREKLGVSRRGKPWSDEHKSRVRNKLLGHRVSPETRAKISRHNKGNMPAPWNKGKPLPADMRAKLSASLKGRPKPAEHLAKLQAGSQRRWEEHRLLIDQYTVYYHDENQAY